MGRTARLHESDGCRQGTGNGTCGRIRQSDCQVPEVTGDHGTKRRIAMKGVSDTVVAELRRKVTEGASVPDMLRLLHRQLGLDSAYSSTLAKYFMAAFDLPL